MQAQRQRHVYDRAVSITHAYLGPTAERFVARQIRTRLHKEPEDITKDDLARLVRWIRLAVSLLTDDVEVVEEYIGKLEVLTRTSRRKSSS